jgi:hypothetical protein
MTFIDGFIMCLVWGQSGMRQGRHHPLDFLDHTATKNYFGVYLTFK